MDALSVARGLSAAAPRGAHHLLLPPHATTTSLFFLAPLCLTHRRLFSPSPARPPASRRSPRRTRPPPQSPGPMRAHGAGCSQCSTGCSPTRSTAARAQVHCKSLEAEGYAVEGFWWVGMGPASLCRPSTSHSNFQIGRGSLFAVREDHLFITHAHLGRIVSVVQAASRHHVRPKYIMPWTSPSSSTPSSQ